MKGIYFALVIPAAFAASIGSVWAQTQGASSAEHGSHHPASSAAPAQSGAAAMTDGEVRRVDRETGRITIRHGAIANLDMPPMTMVFRVKDPTVLERVKEGQAVRFAAERIDGAFTVTQLEPVQ